MHSENTGKLLNRLQNYETVNKTTLEYQIIQRTYLKNLIDSRYPKPQC